MTIFRRVPVVRSPPCQVVKLGGVRILKITNGAKNENLHSRANDRIA